MKGLCGIKAESNENNKKDYQLPDPLPQGVQARTENGITLHNPEWLAALPDSDINQAFIAEVVEKSLHNLMVSTFDGFRRDGNTHHVNSL